MSSTVTPRRRIRRPHALSALVLTTMLAVAGEAQGGLSIGVAIDYPSPVEVGASVTGSILITNLSTQPENAGTVSVYSIRLVPACNGDSVPCRSEDREPFVFAVSNTATGESFGATDGACEGLVFDVQAIPDSSEVLFLLRGQQTVVQLGPPEQANEACRINFGLRVTGSPTQDTNVALPGNQTRGVVRAKATSDVNELTVPAASSTETVVIAAPQAAASEASVAAAAASWSGENSESADSQNESGPRIGEKAEAETAPTPPPALAIPAPTTTASPKPDASEP